MRMSEFSANLLTALAGTLLITLLVWLGCLLGGIPLFR